MEGDYDAPSLLGAELKKDFPEVQYVVTTDWDDTYMFRTEDKALKATGGFAGEDFFKIFSYRLLAGDAVSALNAPGRMAISKGMAVRFFGSPQAAMGKTLHRDSVNKWKNFVVSAVFEEDVHSSLRFDFLLSWHDYKIERPWMQRWDNSGPHTMIVLRENAQPDLVRQKIKGLLHSFNEHPIPGHRTELDMQRFDEHYLHSRFENGNPHGGRIAYVRLFSIVAVFILLIACINFMNLTTARSMQRAREIGVRKVIGAKRGALVGQFLGESIVLATAALMVALILTAMFLPLFNAITGKHMTVPMEEPGFWCQLLGLTLLTGCIAGSYPALYLSSFQPVKVLKGTLASVGGATLLRKGLVVVQFVLSTVLIIGTLVVSKQINYMQTIDIGFQRENLVYIPLEGRLTEKYALFKQEASKLPGILSITSMTDAPTNLDNGTVNMDWDGKARDYIPSFTFTAVDYDYIRTMGIQLVAGRDFSTAFPTDSVGYIVNEAALAKIGYKDPIGRNFTFWSRKGTIIGVVKNFHFASLHDPVSPLVLRFRQDHESGNILVRMQRGQTPKALAGLETLCRQMNPGFPFTYQFSDQEYQRFYTSEIVVGQLSRCFAALAISISCLGLLGLALFTAEQRTK
ncbi:MAG TPA: ABC transporter permease, partial [Puia sp.]